MGIGGHCFLHLKAHRTPQCCIKAIGISDVIPFRPADARRGFRAVGNFPGADAIDPVTLRPVTPVHRPQFRLPGDAGLKFSEAAALFIEEMQRDPGAAVTVTEHTRGQHDGQAGFDGNPSGPASYQGRRCPRAKSRRRHAARRSKLGSVRWLRQSIRRVKRTNRLGSHFTGAVGLVRFVECPAVVARLPHRQVLCTVGQMKTIKPERLLRLYRARFLVSA